MKRREFISLRRRCRAGRGRHPRARNRKPGCAASGFSAASTSILEADLVRPFRKALGDLGYVEGRDIAIEYRWAEGNYQRLPALVAELVAAGVELIVTAGTPAAFAVRNATPSVPCVMVAVGDPSEPALSPVLPGPAET